MSERLSKRGLSHLVVERRRIAERWRSERWDGLHANGPAWHDRFSGVPIAGVDSDGFATRDQMVDYFVSYVERIAYAPVRCGVAVTALHKMADGTGFRAETSEGVIEVKYNLLAGHWTITTPGSSRPSCRKTPGSCRCIPTDTAIPASCRRGRCWWSGLPRRWCSDRRLSLRGTPRLSVRRAPPAAAAPLSGTRLLLLVRRARDVGYSGRRPTAKTRHDCGPAAPAWRPTPSTFVALQPRCDVAGPCGSLQRWSDAQPSPDLASNLAHGDASYLSLLDAADAYAAREGLDLPEEPAARTIGPQPPCVTDPTLRLNLQAAGIAAIVWATGYALDFGWLKVDAFDERGAPVHRRGITDVPGLYFLGLPWLSRRASSFIFGVEHDAAHLAEHIAARAQRPTSVQ